MTMLNETSATPAANVPAASVTVDASGNRFSQNGHAEDHQERGAGKRIVACLALSKREEARKPHQAKGGPSPSRSRSWRRTLGIEETPRHSGHKDHKPEKLRPELESELGVGRVMKQRHQVGPLHMLVQPSGQGEVAGRRGQALRKSLRSRPAKFAAEAPAGRGFAL